MESQAWIGEIVEASTTGLRAVASDTSAAPAFGSFCRTHSGLRTTYAVVANVSHGSLDPTRRAIPLGRSRDELAREQPQILQLLVTEFEAVAVGFTEGGRIEAWLPPSPPRVHDFIYSCAAAEVAALTEDVGFVRTLAAAASRVSGELVAAAIRFAAEARAEPGGPASAGSDRRRFLLRAGREVADLYRQDYEQARWILRRLGMRVAGDEFPAPPSPFGLPVTAPRT